MEEKRKTLIALGQQLYDAGARTVQLQARLEKCLDEGLSLSSAEFAAALEELEKSRQDTGRSWKNGGWRWQRNRAGYEKGGGFDCSKPECRA